ncbi:hypothetical protein OBBRIDRAFT_793486 [Obba rivulosa]|uniref:Uncharacterized protein n=1 Tax=Obba rivulosa TaxID=1052685 RepID=A0A8E2B113_9APHY|nr:hypothetical protein OBBRIDRAFT_793486 [Obba rivulosa]
MAVFGISVSPLFILRIVSPSLVLLATLTVIFTRPPPPQTPSSITPVVVATRIPRRALILALLSLSAATYFLDGLTFALYTVFRQNWPQNTGIEYNSVLGLAAFAGLAALGAWKDVNGVDVWSLKRLKLSIGTSLALDIAQVVLLGLSLAQHVSIRRGLHLVFPAFRVLSLIPLVAALWSPRVAYVPAEAGEETAPSSSSLLLPPEVGTAPSTGLAPVTVENSKYGTFRTARSLAPSGPTTRTPTPAPSNARVPAPKEKEEVNPDPSWAEIFRRLRRILPYLWPSRSVSLQIVAALCIILVLIGRVVNLLTPYMFAEVVRRLTQDSSQSPWPYLFAYVGLRFLQGSGGLSALRDALWAPVLQYSDREMSQLSFNHLMNLSLAFHTRRKTGEILRILDRGSAINHTFELLLFNIVPTFIDIFVALVLFCIYFEWTLTLVIAFVMVAYIAASVILTRWRTKLRRQMNERDMVTRAIHTDCLLNYETVKYFNGEEHEAQRYGDAIRQYQALEYRVILSLNLLNLVQNFIITMSLLVGSLIVALRVTRGESRPDQFVYFIMYITQLYGPLNMLGYIYRSVNQSLVDTEKLLKLLNEPTEVNDKPNAPDLVVQNGEIEFENVNFSYDDRTTALNGVSFKVPKNSSVALVGESGSGKSTILRLLYRFYDLKEGEGRILIDGQDIRDVTQSSLRKAIGVVPQDCVLFNASIAYNIGYGKFGASKEEIEAAAKAAQMHDRIMSFPDGYETKVGERGVRLSGGEKQRVAIARTLLKNPPILLLDEATSALDTQTEKDIQKALLHLMEGRSSLSIAHRLSTIASADLILVLKDGQIVEQGSHADLLARNGIFAAMWADQIQGSEDGVSSHKKEVTGYSVETEELSAKVEPDDAVNGTVIAEVVNTLEETPDPPIDTSVPAGEDLEQVEEPVVVGAEVVEAVAQDEPAEAAPGVSPAPPAAMNVTGQTDAAATGLARSPPVLIPKSAAAVTFPGFDEEAIRSSPEESAPVVAFPSDDPAPVAFPGSPDSGSAEPSVSERIGSPGVKFRDSETPPRTGTPDVETDGRRKRTLSTQGIQRLARRISISTRRQDSGSGSSIPKLAGAMIPGLKRENTAVTKDESSSKDTPRESPTASVDSDVGKTKSKKKEKKSKRKSTP